MTPLKPKEISINDLKELSLNGGQECWCLDVVDKKSSVREMSRWLLNGSPSSLPIADLAWLRFELEDVRSLAVALEAFVQSWNRSELKAEKVYVQIDAASSDYCFIVHEALKSCKGLDFRYFAKRKEVYTQEELFQLSTFFGKLALKAETHHLAMRQFYNRLSYEVLNWGEYPVPRNYEQSFFPSLSGQILSIWDEMSGLEKWLHAGGKEVLMIQPVQMAALMQLGSQKLRAALRKLRSVFKGKEKPSLQQEASKNGVQVSNPRLWKRVMITGWYGTETTGDKAIIGEIIHQLRRYNPDLHVAISSIDFRVSWQTAVEMNMQNVSFVPIRECFKESVVSELDAVIMGGGPLMESSQIEFIHALFLEANRQEKARVIYGCGVGPIHTDGMSKWISDIIRVSSVAFYRDQQSVDYAKRLGGIEETQLACDPALAYVKRWMVEHPLEGNTQGWASLLRSQTAEYYTGSDLQERNKTFSNAIQAGLVSNSKREHLSLLAMHMYWRGNDDREFNYALKKDQLASSATQLELSYLSLDAVIEALQKHRLALAMRYHGHLFCLALGIPFISVDYTGKAGKVSNLLERTGLKDWSMKFSAFEAGKVRDMASRLKKDETQVHEHIVAVADQLLTQLHSAYDFFWSDEKFSA